jgi:hypothetical protein
MNSQENELWRGRYEQLRQQVLEPGATLTQDRWGLGLLIRKGMAGWMRVWQDPAGSVEPTASTTPAALIGATNAWQQQAKVLLANMALSQCSTCPQTITPL